MKFKGFLIFTILISNLLKTDLAQTADLSFNKFRALLNSGDRIEIEKGVLTDTALLNYANNIDPKYIPLSSIRALDRRTGSQAIKGLLIGGGIGLLSSLYAVLEIEADPNKKLKDNAGAIFAGITAGGALVGLIVGSLFDKWESVPLNVKLNANINNSSYRLSFGIYF